MIPKTISPTDLRKNLYSVVKDVAAGKSQYLVTPSEGDSVLICSRGDYDVVVQECELLRSIRASEADFKAGRVFSHEQIMKEFAQLAKRGRKRSPKPKR
jgi:PHD/YefM family antitoxin component YafN of YafNO toxin-antitoxin module